MCTLVRTCQGNGQHQDMTYDGIGSKDRGSAKSQESESRQFEESHYAN